MKHSQIGRENDMPMKRKKHYLNYKWGKVYRLMPSGLGQKGRKSSPSPFKVAYILLDSPGDSSTLDSEKGKKWESELGWGHYCLKYS